MVTILNTSILTGFGNYVYRPISVDDAKRMIAGGFQSAIGHAAAAQIISTVLGVDCPMNRINYVQQLGEMAIVFKLNGRAEEGKILTAEECESIGYSFGLLLRTI